MRNSRHPRPAWRLAAATAALVPLLAGALVAGSAHASASEEPAAEPVVSTDGVPAVGVDPGHAVPVPVAVEEVAAAAPADELVPTSAPEHVPTADAVSADAAPAADADPDGNDPGAPTAVAADSDGAADAVTGVVQPGQSIVVNRTITGASELTVVVGGPVGEKRIEVVPPGGVASGATGLSATVAFRLHTGSPLPDGSYRILIHNRSDQPMEFVYEIAWRSADVAFTPLPSRPRTGLVVETEALFDGGPMPDGTTATVRATAVDGTEHTGTLVRSATSPDVWRAYLGGVIGDFVIHADFAVGGATHSATWATTIDSLDDVLPALEYLTEPAASNSRGWFARPVTVTLRASDSGSGVSRIDWELDGRPLVSTPGGIVQIDLGHGIHRLDYRAYDAAGNATSWNVREPRIDTVAPTVDIRTPSPNAEYVLGETVTVDYACDDALSGPHECLAALAPGASVPTDVEGDFSLEVVATDRAGNLTRETVHYRVVDPGLPVVELVLPSAEGDDGWYLDFPVLDLVGTPNAVEIHWTDTVDGVEVSGSVAGSSTTFTPEREGVHELRYWGVDAFGRTGEPASAEFRIDASDPEIEVRSPVARSTARALAPGQVVLGTVLAADFSCDDLVSGIADCVGSTPDGQRLPTGTLGMHSFTVRATDAAGRTAERVVAYEVVSAAAAEDPRGLAATGVETAALGAVALMLLTAGGVAVLVTRRRAVRG